MPKKHFINLMTDKLTSLGLTSDEVTKQTGKLAQTLKILSDEDVSSLIENIDNIAQQIFILSISNSVQNNAESHIETLKEESDTKSESVAESPEEKIAESKIDSSSELSKEDQILPTTEVEAEISEEKTIEEKIKQSYENITDTMPTINNSALREKENKSKNSSSVKGLNLVIVDQDSKTLTNDAFTSESLTNEAFTSEAFTSEAFTSDAFTNEALTSEAFINESAKVGSNMSDTNGFHSVNRHSILEDLKQVEQKHNEFVDNYEFVQDIEPPKTVKATPMFWWTIALSTPITIPILAACLAVFGALYVTIILLIIAIIAVLIALVGAATLMALAPIIYGIAQAFSYVPVGLFEIGIGVTIAGVAMFVGILLYNIAIRLCPYLIRKLSQLLKLSIVGLEKLFEYLKGAIAKI